MPDQTHLLYGWLITVGVCAVIGAIIGFDKGKAGPGFFYGLFLGPLGLFFAALADDERIQCAVCRAWISPLSSVCPKCHASMAKLSTESVSHGTATFAVDVAPRPVPATPRVAIAKTPRVAIAKMTRAISKVTQALEQVPVYLVRRPVKVIRVGRDKETAPLTMKVKGPRAVVVAPPAEFPKVARATAKPHPPTEAIDAVNVSSRPTAKAPRFFLFKPGDQEARGPYDLAQIQALLECGVITSDTQFCREGENEWKSSFTV